PEMISLDLDQTRTIKVTVENGRRTTLAVVPPVGAQRRVTKDQASERTVSQKIRALVQPDFVGSARSPGARLLPDLPLAARQTLSQVDGSKVAGLAAVAPVGGGLNYNAQAVVEGEQVRLRLQPVFQTLPGTGAPRVNLPLIPGGND